MRLTGMLLLMVCTLRPAAVFCQNKNITVNCKNEKLIYLLKTIKEQTEYGFMFKDGVVDTAFRRTIEFRNINFEKALQLFLEGSALEYSLLDQTIVIRPHGSNPNHGDSGSIRISGLVKDDRFRLPIEGVSVELKGSSKTEISGIRGAFNITVPADVVSLVFSSVGYEKKEISINPLRERRDITVLLHAAVKVMDEMIVVGYDAIPRRRNTGNVFKIKAADIETQPITNPLEVLAGRVPGLTATVSNGMPSSDINILVRGHSSLAQGTQPLYIVDGIPWLFDQSTGIGQVAFLNNQNPFNTINAFDLESIEVLKDAGATAIYGSQGANGVILITTKKGVTGKLRLDVNSYYGISRVGRTPELLDKEQYLEMRREAFTHDGVTPDISSAPDLLVWDLDRSTDWKKELIGGSAATSNLHASLSGGTSVCQYYISGSSLRNTTVFPNDNPFTRTTIRTNVNLVSQDQKTKMLVGTSYGTDSREFPGQDLMPFIFLPVNAPAMKDGNGNLLWKDIPVSISNPYSRTLKEFSGQNESLSGNAVIQRVLTNGLDAKINLGYEQLNNDEYLKEPIRSLRPAPNVTGSLTYGTSKYKSWIIEPQLIYHSKPRNEKTDVALKILIGASWQKRENMGLLIRGTNYKDDNLLGNISAAPKLSSSNYTSIYKYNAVFGRISYNLMRRYLADISLRRDGSSRFGPANRFSNFGAISAGWIFTNEPAFSDNAEKLVSFGKLRASIGITGNDQIGDYRFYDRWVINGIAQYDSVVGMVPVQLSNPKLRWERNIKHEVGVELGFIRNQLLFSAAYYSNTGSNQLINYSIPYQTGFTTLIKNVDAEIRNDGFEFELSYRNANDKLSWYSSFNLTIPRNRLIRYPGLENSADFYNYRTGEPLSVQFGYIYKGVNPSTGVYEFQDQNKDGVISNPNDIVVTGNTERAFYGGLQNTFTYKRLECEFLLQVVKQTGYDWFINMQAMPGQMWNQPDMVLDRWRQQDDQTALQAWSNATYTPQYKAFTNLQNSNANLVDASFIRLKSASIGYVFNINQGKKFSRFKLFIESQNLLTFTRYKGADPEIQSLTTLPSLRKIVGGIQLMLK